MCNYLNLKFLNYKIYKCYLLGIFLLLFKLQILEKIKVNIISLKTVLIFIYKRNTRFTESRWPNECDQNLLNMTENFTPTNIKYWIWLKINLITLNKLRYYSIYANPWISDVSGVGWGILLSVIFFRLYSSIFNRSSLMQNYI